jgi:hypothetical protein
MRYVASDELESIFGEGEQQGTEIGSTLRHVWEQDKHVRHDAAKNSFFVDQEKNGKFIILCECKQPWMLDIARQGTRSKGRIL